MIRINVLQALVDADPTSIHSRDVEGRTCLHTACAEGRSAEILRWLVAVEEEECQSKSTKIRHNNNINGHDDDEATPPERNVTLRTDYPGGALPLHSIAACPTFDNSDSVPNSPTKPSSPQHPNHPINRYLVPSCNVTHNVLCAYASTSVIRKAHPQAVWDRDCDGEIPLHAAASWGNVGSVLALLIGVSSDEGSKNVVLEVARAALTKDDRGKTPLDRACEHVCSLCVHRRKRNYSGGGGGGGSLRRSITREDPFRASIESNTGDTANFRQSITREDPFFQTDGASSGSLRQSIAREDPFETDGATNGSLRQSITREDPFSTSAVANGGTNPNNGGRRSFLRRGGSGSRRRIPGCGSSFRSSLSSSFTRGGPSLLDDLGYDNDLDPTVRDDDDDGGGGSLPPSRLRESFVSPRRPVDPIRGLELLDDDGEEELAKVDLLARAAYGFFVVDAGDADFSSDEVKKPNASSLAPPSETAMVDDSVDRFRLLHAVIALGCRPEIIWHVAAKYPHQVGERDEFGRVSLFLACERLAELYHRLTNKLKERRESLTDRKLSYEEDEDAANEGDASDSDLTKFVSSLLLGDDYALLLFDGRRSTIQPLMQLQQQPPQSRLSPENSPTTKISPLMETPSSDGAPTCDGDLIHHLAMTREVINILLHSPLFGQPAMANVPNNNETPGRGAGRLALHVVLDAGLQWIERDGTYGRCASREEEEANGRSNPNDKFVANNNCNSSTVQMLVGACPSALEVRDGKTGLFPFMIAATPKKTLDTFNELKNGECTKQLETVYQLLLKAPTMICHPI